MICPYCKTSNPKGELFCNNCGYNLQLTPAIEEKVEKEGGEMPKVSAEPKDKKEEALPLANLLLPDNTTIQITEGMRIVGREDISKSVPPDVAKYVSREHLAIMFENDQFYIEDGVKGKPSLNGTKLNNVEIKEKGKQLLANGDEILMAGAVKLTFQIICKKCGNPIPIEEKHCPKCTKPTRKVKFKGKPAKKVGK